MNRLNDDSEKWQLMIEKLRKIDGFENIPESTAKKVIDFLVQLAILEYEINSTFFEE